MIKMVRKLENSSLQNFVLSVPDNPTGNIKDNRNNKTMFLEKYILMILTKKWARETQNKSE